MTLDIKITTSQTGSKRKLTASRSTMSRVHDYLYDPVFIVNDAKDFARARFKAAMASAEMNIVPEFRTMFSDLKRYPRFKCVYHPNARLPDHLDLSYEASKSRCERRAENCHQEMSEQRRTLFYPRLIRVPNPPVIKRMEEVPPDKYLETPDVGKPKNVGVQTLYRESSAQTHPWQPEAKISEKCQEIPETLHLDHLYWGEKKGSLITGDLPVDFHTTEIINKIRTKNAWLKYLPLIADKPEYQRRVLQEIAKNESAFREAEIDEVQKLRLSVWKKLANEYDESKAKRDAVKLIKTKERKQAEAIAKIKTYRHNTERELRKLQARHKKLGKEGELEDRGLKVPRAICQLSGNGIQQQHEIELKKSQYATLYDGVEKMDTLPNDLNKFAKLPLLSSNFRMPSKKRPGTVCPRLARFTDDNLERFYQDLKKIRKGTADSSRSKDNKRFCKLLQLRPQTHESMSSATMSDLYADDGVVQHDANADEYTDNEYEDSEEEIDKLVDHLQGEALTSALSFLDKELIRLKEENNKTKHCIFCMCSDHLTPNCCQCSELPDNSMTDLTYGSVVTAMEAIDLNENNIQNGSFSPQSDESTQEAMYNYVIVDDQDEECSPGNSQ